jgi:uncharacterized protein YwqG
MDQHPLPPALEERFRHEVEACGLAEIWPRLRAVARPCWTIDLVPDADLERLGTSRFGGLPDLPAGRPWPEREGQLLTFIGQIDLAEVSRLPVPLPERGLLSFFLGIDEPASNIGHEVLYHDGRGGELSRSPEPDESAFLNEECTAFRPTGVRFLPAVSLPSFFRELPSDEFADRLEELRQRLGSPSAPGKSSQMLGHPLTISGDPLAEAYVAVQGHADILYALHRTPEDLERDLAAATAKGDDGRVEWLQRQKESLTWFHGAREYHQEQIGHWQLLLEVASHRECGMVWWDAGRLQFHIDSRDLEARDFSRTYACIRTS